MKILEKLIPIIVMLIIAMMFFKLGENYQKEKEKPCYQVNIDTKQICPEGCQKWLYGDTVKYINKNHKTKAYILIK